MVSSSDVKLPTGVEIHGKSLRIWFSFQGKRRRESLGLAPSKQNIKFAQAKRETIKFEIMAGTFVYSKHFPDSTNTVGKPAAKPIKDLVKQYLSVKEKEIRSSTLNKYTSMLNVFCELYGGKRSTNTLSPRTVTELRGKLIDGRAARTANTYIRTVAGFFAWLKEMEYTDNDFSKQMSFVKVPERDIDPFTIEEVKKALNACFQDQHKNIITLLAYSGLRTGEICALAWEDIDFENRTMLIRRSTYEARGLKTTKTDRERVVDLLPPAFEALQAQRKLTWFNPAKEYEIELADKTIRIDKIRFVFSPHAITGLNSKRPFDYLGKTATNKMWKNICIRAGIKYRNVYQFRHTYASWMLSSGVNIAYLASQMGHSNFLMIAQIYGKWMENPNLKESDKAWAKLSGVHG